MKLAASEFHCGSAETLQIISSENARGQIPSHNIAEEKDKRIINYRTDSYLKTAMGYVAVSDSDAAKHSGGIS
ncbi:hypothetical protein CEXT_338161 [Caerostris extrusa]|uniref:Uncharacterized protein n=1 Tax=Caerostris extrusa TaxID=172846 RepID=A0AAV4VE82_CAEEX|nr:hypothetical protein CEXT_338161 [Caerostris extrusa]